MSSTRRGPSLPPVAAIFELVSFSLLEARPRAFRPIFCSLFRSESSIHLLSLFLFLFLREIRISFFMFFAPPAFPLPVRFRFFRAEIERCDAALSPPSGIGPPARLLFPRPTVPGPELGPPPFFLFISRLTSFVGLG